MKILALSCVHNDVESILNYSDKIFDLNFDVVICPGDFLDAPTKNLEPLKLGKLIIAALKSLGKPLLVVPGCWDKVLIDVFEKENISIHGKGLVLENVGFYGFGGAKTPFSLPFEPSENEIEEGLVKAYKDVANSQYKIQVTHAPPFNTNLDLIASGAHVGSTAVRKVIEELKPDAAVCTHIHESKGIDKLDKTVIVNTGKFTEGYCSLLSLENGLVKVEMINLT